MGGAARSRWHAVGRLGHQEFIWSDTALSPSNGWPLYGRSSRTGRSGWYQPGAARGRLGAHFEVRSRSAAVMSRRKPRQMGVPQRCRGRSDAIQRCAPPERPLSGGATDCSRPVADFGNADLDAAKPTFDESVIACGVATVVQALGFAVPFRVRSHSRLCVIIASHRCPSDGNFGATFASQPMRSA